MMQSTNVQRQSTGPAPPQATVVYGIPLPPTASDVEVKLVRTVMRLSAFMAIIAVIQQLYLVIVQKFHMQSLLSVLVSLLVPACGWYGAKERNKFFLQISSPDFVFPQKQSDFLQKKINAMKPPSHQYERR